MAYWTPKSAAARAMTWRTESSSTCDECRRFYSNRGLLVRAFECDVSSGWVGWNVELGNRFVSQRDGMRLLTDPSADELARFQGCGLSELKLGPRDEGPAHTVQGRATSILRADITDPSNPTFASNFGLTLSPKTMTAGAYAFDAWTTTNRPFCRNETRMADLRLHFVDSFCHEVATSTSPRWALERRIGRSEANCRFKTVPAMLTQQARYRTRLHRAEATTLRRCPYARHAGGINQVHAPPCISPYLPSPSFLPCPSVTFGSEASIRCMLVHASPCISHLPPSMAFCDLRLPPPAMRWCCMHPPPGVRRVQRLRHHRHHHA